MARLFFKAAFFFFFVYYFAVFCEGSVGYGGDDRGWDDGSYRRRVPRDVMVNVINDLGLALLEVHNEHNENNIAISPYGATSVLVALVEGLRGDAAHEIKYAIHLPQELSIVRIGLRDIHRHLKSYFIPKEGFLAGLTLSHENITLNREYESILRFYGYDVDSFNNPVYPEPFSTTPLPTTTTSESSKTTTPMDQMITETRAPTTTEEIARMETDDTTEMTASTENLNSLKPERTTRMETDATTEMIASTESLKPERTTRRESTLPDLEKESTGTTKNVPVRETMPISTLSTEEDIILSETRYTTPMNLITTSMIDLTTITKSREEEEVNSTTEEMSSEKVDLNEVTSKASAEKDETTTAQNENSKESTDENLSEPGDQDESTKAQKLTFNKLSDEDATTIVNVTKTSDNDNVSTISQESENASTKLPEITSKKTIGGNETTILQTSTSKESNDKSASTTTQKVNYMNDMEGSVETPMVEITEATSSEVSEVKDNNTQTSTQETTEDNSREKTSTIDAVQTTIQQMTEANSKETLTTVKDMKEITEKTTEVIANESSTNLEDKFQTTLQQIKEATSDEIPTITTETLYTTTTLSNELLTTDAFGITTKLMNGKTTPAVTFPTSIAADNLDMNALPLVATLTTTAKIDTEQINGPTKEDLLSTVSEDAITSTISEETSTIEMKEGTTFGTTIRSIRKRNVRGGTLFQPLEVQQNNAMNFEDETYGMFKITANISSPYHKQRRKRSVIDYLIARYYDNYYISSSRRYLPPPAPKPHYSNYQPEVPYTFLVNGKYRESNISFMTYDTVLPFYYIPGLDAMALSFPLDSNMYYLLLVLPVDEQGIDKLIQDFRKVTTLERIVQNLKYTHVKAVIPSFTLKGYVVLTPSLQKLCIRKIFEPRHADFSQLTPEKDIYVTNIEQAVTVTIRNYVDPSTNSGRNLQAYRPVEFRADHPFLYFVMDSQIHVNLMAGKIINPLNSRIR